MDEWIDEWTVQYSCLIFSSLLRNCNSLRRIEVFDCQLISRVGIQKLQRLRRDITIHAYFPPHPPSTPVQNNRRRVTCQCCSLL